MKNIILKTFIIATLPLVGFAKIQSSALSHLPPPPPIPSDSIEAVQQRSMTYVIVSMYEVGADHGELICEFNENLEFFLEQASTANGIYKVCQKVVNGETLSVLVTIRGHILRDGNTVLRKLDARLQVGIDARDVANSNRPFQVDLTRSLIQPNGLEMPLDISSDLQKFPGKQHAYRFHMFISTEGRSL